MERGSVVILALSFMFGKQAVQDSSNCKVAILFASGDDFVCWRHTIADQIAGHAENISKRKAKGDLACAATGVALPLAACPIGHFRSHFALNGLEGLCAQSTRQHGCYADQKHSHEILSFGLGIIPQSVASLMARGHANNPHAPRVDQREAS